MSLRVGRLVDAAELELDAASASSLEGNTNATRNMEVLREFASREPTGKPRRIVLRFLVSPVAIVGAIGSRESRSCRTSSSRRAHQCARDGPARDDPRGNRLSKRRLSRCCVARPSLRRSARDAPQRRWPCARRQRQAARRCVLRRLDQARPDRVIGTNKKDATETVKLLLEDVAAGRLAGAASRATSWTCSRSAAASPCSTPAGRRSTASSRPPASRTAARA